VCSGRRGRVIVRPRSACTADGTRVLRGWLGPLGERNFRLLFVGQVSSFIGDGMVPVAISFAVLDLTGSVADVGLVLASRIAPLACCLIIGGTVADRLPRRALMVRRWRACWSRRLGRVPRLAPIRPASRSAPASSARSRFLR
jgi:hypothetical protein